MQCPTRQQRSAAAVHPEAAEASRVPARSAPLPPPPPPPPPRRAAPPQLVVISAFILTVDQVANAGGFEALVVDTGGHKGGPG